VRLGIEAPEQVVVLREEGKDRSLEWTDPGLPPMPAAEGLKNSQLLSLLGNRLSIAVRGLAVLQDQLDKGNVADAQRTLAEVTDDLVSLRRRMEEDGHVKVPRRISKPCRALLVEDDNNERELLAGFLRMAGVDVMTAGDGSDALDCLRQRNRPDVVLLDMGMPRCDGAAAVREIRSNPALAGLKIFAVSGHTPEEYGIASGPAGIDRWFHKPVDPSALLHDLDEELHESSQRF
jgi:CheY-like chemotaxis protein